MRHRRLVAACTVETFTQAADRFASRGQEKPIAIPGWICLVCSPQQRRRISRTRRQLLDATNLQTLDEAWRKAIHTDGDFHWFLPSPAMAIYWISGTNARTLAIPVPAETEPELLGYLLQIDLPPRQGSRYFGQFADLGVTWQEGSLPGHYYGQEKSDRIQQLRQMFAALVVKNK